MSLYTAELRRLPRYVKWTILAPRIKVGFVIAGVQKGGTTALHYYLKTHPQICLSRKKEAQFFNQEEHFRRGRADYFHYHSLFHPQPQHRIFGEATPDYVYWQDAPRRMWEYNPNLKVVLLFRNPITRAHSQWNMERLRKTEPLSFWDAIQHETERARQYRPYQNEVTGYVDRGFYSEQLRRIWRYFPREQTLIFKNEDLQKNPEDVLRKTYAFLGVDEVSTPAPETIHSYPYSEPLEDRAKEYLQNLYAHDIRMLEQMLGWDCSNWLS